MVSNTEIIDFFKKLDTNIITNQSEKDKYDIGWRYGKGSSLCVLRPKNNQLLAKILVYCDEHKISVIPQGGNTSLVGSATPDNSGKQIIISSELLYNNFIEIDNSSTKNTSGLVGAGVILEQLNNKLEPDNIFFPIDIGSKGSANIGGMAASNAAGTRACKYGNMLSRTLALEIVTANGEIKTIHNPLHNHFSTKNEAELLQDNSKPTLLFPFIGSGGNLAFITKVKLSLAKLAKTQQTIMLVTENQHNIALIRKTLKQNFTKYFSAFETCPINVLKIVATNNSENLKYIFAGDENLNDDDYAILIELVSENPEDKEILEKQLEDIVIKLWQGGFIKSARMDNKEDILWRTRHHISESLRNLGQVIAFDISIKGIDNLSNFRTDLKKIINDKYPFIIQAPFGHEMIGACHYNLVIPKNLAITINQEEKLSIQKLVYDLVIKYQGSISAEHGIGVHNQHFYDLYTSQIFKDEYHKIKKLYDPNNIMNPNVRYY